jgi:hypothetical protein
MALARRGTTERWSNRREAQIMHERRPKAPSTRALAAAGASRRTPYLQGQIDGLCGLYAIVNAFQCLFPATFTDDDAWELMTTLCEAITHKFPAVIWKGAGVEDTVTLFDRGDEAVRQSQN